MLSTKNSTSWPYWSRNYSARVRPVSADARAGTRRLVHLAVDQRHLGLGQVLDVDDAGLDHLVVEVVALAGALADAGEHRDAAVHLGDVVDQLLDQHGLADAGTAEEADLAALGVGGEQVDDLDAGDEHLGFGRLLDEVGGRGVDRGGTRRLDRALLVHRLADDVEDAAEGAVADRDRDRRAGVVDGRPRARPSVASMAMARTVDSPSCWATSSTRRLPLFVGLERVQDRRQGVSRTGRRRPRR